MEVEILIEFLNFVLLLIILTIVYIIFRLTLKISNVRSQTKLKQCLKSNEKKCALCGAKFGAGNLSYSSGGQLYCSDCLKKID